MTKSDRRDLATGERVIVSQFVYLGRWVQAGEKGTISGRIVTELGRVKYYVRLDSGETFCLAPADIMAAKKGPPPATHDR